MEVMTVHSIGLSITSSSHFSSPRFNTVEHYTEIYLWHISVTQVLTVINCQITVQGSDILWPWQWGVEYYLCS